MTKKHKSLPEIDESLHGRPLTPGESIAVLKQHYNDLPPTMLPIERRDKVLLLKALRTFEALVTMFDLDEIPERLKTNRTQT